MPNHFGKIEFFDFHIDDAPMSKEPQEVNYAEANASDHVTQAADTTDEDTKAPTS